MTDTDHVYRSLALGRTGMVACAHPLGTLTGIDVLKGGGTAADAAVAVNAVLAVTQPPYCGLGGDFFCLYYEAATGQVHCLNGAGRSGSRASLEEMRRRNLQAPPISGPGSVSVPGCVAAWQMLLDRFGTQPMATLLAPAIYYAEAGFPATRLVSHWIRERHATFTDPEWHRIFAPSGHLPAVGDLVVQTDLAATLRAIAEEGLGVFYRGRIGKAILQRIEADGFLTGDDLATHAGEWGEPLCTSYRGYTVYETGLPTQGLAVLLALNLVEGFRVADLRLHSADHLHLMIEVVKMAYADRDRWVADPDEVRVPAAQLLTKEYAQRRRTSFDRGKAQSYEWGDPSGDTTGFVITDTCGNMISAIQSLFHPFGSGVVAPGTGVILHNRGSQFNADREHPNCFGPRKRPFHTLIASIVIREGRPVVGFATMGASGQAMFHVQVLTNVLDFGLDIQEAIDRPRFLMGPLSPDEPADTIRVESRIAARSLAVLARRGHRIVRVPDFFQRMGHAHGIVIREGTLMGGADLRGDGVALGY